MTEGRRIEKKVEHLPGWAKPEAAFDDFVHFSEYTIDPNMDTLLQIESMRTASVGVTAEFMRDAVAPLEVAGRILDRAA